MRTLIAIYLLITLLSCADGHSSVSETEKNDTTENVNPFAITAIDTEFPLKLDEVNLEDKNNTIKLNDQIVTKIDETVKAYAIDIEFYDSSQTYRDTYINTIRLRDRLQTIFLVLLKNYPAEEVSGQVLFYDNNKKAFATQGFDFKLYALYSFDNGKLIPSNLKSLFKINAPEIEVVDINMDGINEYKFVRLWHNGTFNALHTMILSVNKESLDTLYFSEKSLGNEK